MNIGAAVNFASDGGADGVDDADGFDALALEVAEAGESVGGFAGLRDDEGDGVVGDVGVAVTIFRSHDGFNGDVGGELFNVVARQNAGVIGGAATDDEEMLDVFELFNGEIGAAEVDEFFGKVDAPAESFGERGGLFHDFFQEEVVITTFLDGGEVGFDGFYFGGDRLRAEGFDFYGVAFNRGNFTVA